MSVDNHGTDDYSPEWHTASMPDQGVHEYAEKLDSKFQYVFDQLDLMKREDPDHFSKRLNAYKPLWKLSKNSQQRILNHFIEPMIREQEQSESDTPYRENTPEEDRLQEFYEDVQGLPSYMARAKARGEEPEVPTLKIPNRLNKRVDRDIKINDKDPFQQGSAANDQFIRTELARGAFSVVQTETQATEPQPIPETESQPTKKPEPIKFGIEPDDTISHTQREHQSAKKLRGEEYNVGGGLRYLKVISNYGGGSREERIETMTKSLNHMFDYEEDARKTKASLEVFLRYMSQHTGGADELLSVQPFMKKPEPAIIRALEAVTYYREAKAAEGNRKKRVKGTISERVERTVLNDTVDNVETDAADLYFLEDARQRLWDLQLRGREADAELGISKRLGAIDIVKDIPELGPMVYQRLPQRSDDSLHQVAS